MSSPLSVLPDVPTARVVGNLPQVWQRAHTDSRSINAGDFFVALRGERFDAHNFLPQLSALGVNAALAEHGLAAAGLCGVEVSNSAAALGDWAQRWRAHCTHTRVIAVTGSNGKTTVTQMIASILAAAQPQGWLATQGNLNNAIGVPLTLLRLQPTHRWAVVELGMNHPGEIAPLARMAQPQVALVNNAQREHQEHMHSVDAVADENATVFDGLPGDGVAVMPHDSPYTSRWRARAQAAAASVQAWTFAVNQPQATVHATAQWQGQAWQLLLHTPVGEIHCTLGAPGMHNVHNALAAATCALAAGVPAAAVQQGLTLFQPVSGRGQRLLVARAQGQPLIVVDDSYNANPDSVLAAIEVLSTLPDPRWLVLGDMGEVGEQGVAFHVEVLQRACDAALQRVDVVGDWMARAHRLLSPAQQQRVRLHPTVDALQQHVAEGYASAASVLVKGSRFMRMERVVRAIEELGVSASPQEPTHAA